METKVIINRGDTDVRVAFLEDSTLVEFHRESLDQKSIVGNIYRGVVQDVIPGLQAAFVDVGGSRNMFLHFMDIRPEALVMDAEDLEGALEEAAKTVLPGRINPKGRRPRPDLKAQNVPAPVKPGDVIIVQVVKAEINDKAPRVTTNLTLAGRYLVLLPFPSQTGGVSRRVALGQERFKLKKLLHRLRTDEYSFIVRTAGVGAEEDKVQGDVDLLLEQWERVVENFRSSKKPGLVHSDQDIVARLVRDAFTEEIDEIVTDDPLMADELRNVLVRMLPGMEKNVTAYTGQEPIFDRYLIEQQLRKALHRKVWLRSGGHLIIDEMEALTAIDVNTGRFTGSKDQERTSFKTNMEACEAVAQQIRLRDIGGIVVVDFIDMLSGDNQQKVSEELRRQLRRDRAKVSLGKIGDFGLMMLTRKRKHQSLQKYVFDDCPYCQGDGMVLRAGEVWRRIKNDLVNLVNKSNKSEKLPSAIVVSCDPHVAESLEQSFKSYVDRFTHLCGVQVIIRPNPELHREDYQLTPIHMPKAASVQVPPARISEAEVYTEALDAEDLAPSELSRLGMTHATIMEEGPAEAGPEAESEEGDQDDEDPKNAKRTRRGRRGGRRRRAAKEAAEKREAEQNGDGIPEAKVEMIEPSEPAPARAMSEKASEVTPISQVPREKPAPGQSESRKLRSAIQIVSHFGTRFDTAKPVEPREAPSTKPAKEVPVIPSIKSADSGSAKPLRSVKVLSSWGQPVNRNDPEEKATPPGTEEKKPARRRGRKSAKKAAAESAESVAPPAGAKVETAQAETATEAAPRPATKKAAKKAASASSKKAAKKAAKKAGKKAAKKAAKKATSAGSKKAAKKATKKAAKKASKKAAKKPATQKT